MDGTASEGRRRCQAAAHPGPRGIPEGHDWDEGDRRAPRQGAAQDAWFEGVRRDAWFDGRRVQKGGILLVRESSGWGPHNRDPNVLYVRSLDVEGELPPVTESAVDRHRARQRARRTTDRDDNEEIPVSLLWADVEGDVGKH